MSPDLPFLRREGSDEITSVYNRIAAIERIKHLSGIDLREKSKEYKYLLDCEMYQLYYKELPQDTPIDEEFCQHAADVIKRLEKEKDLDKIIQEAPSRVEQLYTSAQKAIPKTSQELPYSPPKFHWHYPFTGFLSIMGQSIKNVYRKKQKV